MRTTHKITKALGVSLDDLFFDPFLGSGTTAYETESLNRNFIGIDIQKNLVDYVGKHIESKNSFSDLIVGDSAKIETFEKVKKSLKNHKNKIWGFITYWKTIT